jgi:hypothetical protein
MSGSLFSFVIGLILLNCFILYTTVLELPELIFDLYDRLLESCCFSLPLCGGFLRLPLSKEFSKLFLTLLEQLLSLGFLLTGFDMADNFGAW